MLLSVSAATGASLSVSVFAVFSVFSVVRVWGVETASAITASWVASAAASSPAIRPWAMTSTRSLMPSTSGRSLEIISTAAPAAVSSLISS